ncbi:MAG: SHOCT domain-containing protein [Candidatus Binatia bacterium]
MMDGMGMMVWGLVTFLLVLLVLFLFVLATAYAVKRMWGQGSERREDSALGILKKRYAKGEISREEFERIKKEIE